MRMVSDIDIVQDSSILEAMQNGFREGFYVPNITT